MKKDRNINFPLKGMNRDTHPSKLTEQEYSLAINANIEDETGSGIPTLQNEHSNILCTKFKPQYKVIGFKHDLNADRTYYFLTNPETGVSEIGYISSIQQVKNVDDLPMDCGCDVKNELNTPLENTIQNECCTYTTLIQDDCNQCLNFDINYPIREGNIQFKDEKCGKRLYWTDDYNPPRYLDLSNLDQYTTIGIATCEEDTLESTCLDCEKLRIFPNFEKPCIKPVSIQYGGSLKKGVYEFLVAGCDSQGNEKTQYYSITPPISIFDPNDINVDQTDLDSRTNLGIRLEISDLDFDIGHYKVAVIQRADSNAATSYFIEGVHSITDTTVLYYTEVDKQRTTLNRLLAPKVVYDRVSIMASSNGYLLQAGLTAKKEINLQPYMNLMGSFVRWKTVQATEDLYKDGVNCSKYRGFMRDEVYPLSIRFYTTDGFETANFVLPGRPPTPFDLEIVDNTDTQSVTEYVPECTTENRNMRWQYYNTASVIGVSCIEESDADLDINCDPIPHAMGKFAYWESGETYPDNKDLYDSSWLTVSTATIPESIREEFEEYFATGVFEGNYTLVQDGDPDGRYSTDFSCKPIRHQKFPDYCVSPFMDTETPGIFQESTIYPIGVHIDEDVINYFLDLAVVNGSITQKDRDKIHRFEVFRGDRTLNKAIIAKGLAYDMYRYNEDDSDTDIYYPNYPYNDLGEDDLNYDDDNRENLIDHPYQGESNNRYTFHSPDTHFHMPTLPTEVKVEAYQCGESAGKFAEVKDHSRWVILSNLPYTTATILATTEALFEIAIQYGDFQVQNAIAGDTTTQYTGDVDTTGNVNGTFNAGITGIGLGTGVGTITSGPGTINFNNIALEHDYSNLGYETTNQNALSTFQQGVIIAQWISQASSKIQQLRFEWLKIFKENGQPENFAYYYTSEGYYNYLKCADEEGQQVRGLCGKKYLKPGRIKVHEKGMTSATKVNNFHRESSVYLSFGENFNLEYPQFYLGQDNSRFISSDVARNTFDIDNGLTDENGDPIDNFNYTGRSPEVYSRIGSPYMSLRNYLPNQYGKIGGIKWIPMGHCGKLDQGNTCNTIFGGDVFISRFSLKRKMPLFVDNMVGAADLIPFNYYPYRNIGHTRFYCDYDTTDSNTIINPTGNTFFDLLINFTVGTAFPFLVQPFPDIRSFYNFDEEFERGFYVRPPSKFYLFYYGIPQFLVESEINCNFRHAGRELHQDFYPHVGDYEDWTQETNVSIKRDNEYRYNDVYSKNTSMVNTRILPNTFDQETYDCYYDSPNGVIVSLQDVSENDLNDPWLIYRPLDTKQFKTSFGKLIDLRDIESAQVLARFENGFAIYNAIDTLRDRLTPNTQELGSGWLFSSRPLEFKQTDLGYGGTQHKSMVSCEFGHFWVDAKRGQVFQVDQNGRNLKEITQGMRNWFKEQLPSKLLASGVAGFTEDHVDNQFKGIGIAMGWDARFRRVFLTKRDYVPTEQMYYECDNFYLQSELDGLIEQFVGLGYSYEGIVDCRASFSFGSQTVFGEITPIPLTDRQYFEDASCTMAYSPVTQSWISYYDFKPDYYVGYHNYFQTGLNYSSDIREEGLWSHLLTNRSYTVFYGKHRGWTIELPIQDKYLNKTLDSVTYWMDTRRYHNECDFAQHRNVGFNKAWIYNHSNNSGQLNLVTEKPNDMSQRIKYPIFRSDSIDILATENDHKWSFNYFFNFVRNERNNVPVWLNDGCKVDKSINISALNYRPVWKDRLRGDWFLLKLRNDGESRLKQIFKWSNSKESLYEG